MQINFHVKKSITLILKIQIFSFSKEQENNFKNISEIILKIIQINIFYLHF